MANLTWVVFEIPDAIKHTVRISGTIVDYIPPHMPDMHAATIGILVQWTAEQPASLEKECDLLMISRIGVTNSGLCSYTPKHMPCIYVPKSCRCPLWLTNPRTSKKWIRLFAISFLVTEAKSTPFDSEKYEFNFLKKFWVQSLAYGHTMAMQREHI